LEFGLGIDILPNQKKTNTIKCTLVWWPSKMSVDNLREVYG